MFFKFLATHQRKRNNKNEKKQSYKKKRNLHGITKPVKQKCLTPGQKTNIE